MTELTPLDAAFFAFRKRETRFVLTRAAIAYVALSLVIGAAAVAVTWPAIMGLADWYFGALRAISHGEEPATPPMAPFLSLLPWSLAFGMLGWVLFAAFEATCLRWLVRNERGGGLLGITFGADTWRVFATYWVWIAMTLAAVVVICAFYFGLRALSGLHPAAQMAVMLIAALAPLAMFALVIFGAVRLSPAAAASIAHKRFAFFNAWPATRGVFWPLLGAFIIVAVGYSVIFAIVGGVIRIPFDTAAAPIMRSMLSGADAASLFEQAKETFVTPFYLGLFAVYAIFARVLAMVLYVTWFGINARAMQAR